MKEEIVKKVEDALSALAEKIGTTAEYLWEILVRQAYVEAATYATFGVAAVIAIIITIKIANRAFVWDEGINDLKIRDNGTHIFVTFLVSAVLGFFLTLAFLLNFTSMVTGFINPEYYALEKILERL